MKGGDEWESETRDQIIFGKSIILGILFDRRTIFLLFADSKAGFFKDYFVEHTVLRWDY